MTLYDWLLFLHVLAAFAAVAAVVLLSVILAMSWRSADVVDATPLLRMSRLGSRLWDVGGAGTLIFGIWLAVYVEGYELWDGWIVAALVLWVIAATAGTRVGAAFRRAFGADAGHGELGDSIRSQRALIVHAVMALAVAALLIVMIYKPGA
ncbi:MAG: hypothetical protein ABI783_12105 [Actinomycetota bacterium]